VLVRLSGNGHEECAREKIMKINRFFGLGLFTGVGLGQTIACLLLRGECRNAPGMIAVSTFGWGMLGLGALMTFVSSQKKRTN
jgi:hypothetical protein